MSAPAVAIILPCHNVAMTVNATLNALMKQDFALPYLVIAVDDNSTDRTIKILADYQKYYPDRLKVLQSTSGCNLSKARNMALPMALLAKYVGFCDADDVPQRHFISKLYSLAEHTGADCAVMNYRLIDSATDTIRVNRAFYAGRKTLKGFKAARAILKDGKCKAYVWNKLYRSELLKRTKIKFLTGIKSYEDLVFSFQCFLNSTKVAFAATPVYDYYLRPHSVSHAPDPNTFLMHIYAYASCHVYLTHFYGPKVAAKVFAKNRFTMNAKVIADILTARTLYSLPLHTIVAFAHRFLTEINDGLITSGESPWSQLVSDMYLPDVLQLAYNPYSYEFTWERDGLWKSA